MRASLATRKQPLARALLAPVLPQQRQKPRAQNRVSVFRALAAAHVDKHARGVDVRQFELDHFAAAQPRAVTHHQGGSVLYQSDVAEKRLHLLHAQDHRQLLRHLHARELLVRPRHLEGDRVQELRRGHETVDALRRELTAFQQVELVGADVVQAEPFRAHTVVLGKIRYIVNRPWPRATTDE